MTEGGAKTMKTAILIHGAWVTPLCWRYLAPFFEERGYRTLAPAWPFKDRAVRDQLVDPDPRLAKVGIPEVVAHYKEIIRNQSEPPLLIGHSFGGLIVQLLLDQGCGAAGIAISSVPPRGIPALGLSPLKVLRKLWRLFGAPSRWRGVLPPPPRDPNEKALRKTQGIDLYLVPESRKIFRQLLTRAARVDFRNPARGPLLLVGCGEDRCVPVKVQRRNWERYRPSAARTDFVLFPDLTHLGIAEPGHEALAAYCIAWVDDHLEGQERRMAMSGPFPDS
jgi:alpha-beta hydrolase superfamily lysophospholipase